MEIREFDSLPSTNKYCELLDMSQVGEFTVVWARRQTDGIGQRGNQWQTDGDKNLTFTLVLHPTFIQPSLQFSLTKALALAITDWLRSQQIEAMVKWPNDIYVGDRKICGILVENRISQQWDTAICGIGFNVNQTAWPADVPNAVSLSQLTGRQWQLRPILEALLAAIQQRYNQLRLGDTAALDSDYLSRLLRLGIQADYLLHGKPIKATIQGVTPFGHLQLQLQDHTQTTCSLKELTFLF